MAATTRPGPGGGQPIVQRISLTGAEEVKRLLEGMGAQGEKAAAQIGRAMSASGGDTARLGQAVEGAFIGIGAAGAKLKPATAAVDELHGGFRGIGSTLNNLAAVLLPNFTSKMGLGIAGIALGLKGVLGTAKNSILEMRNLSLQTGLSINTIQGIKDVFEDQGVPVEKLSTVVGKFSEELGKARLEAQKLDGPLGSPFDKAGEKVTVLRGDIDKLNSSLEETTTVLRGASQQVRDTSSAFASLGMKADVLKRFPDTMEGNKAALIEFSRRLNKVADESERARIGAQMFGRQWRSEAAGILAIAKNLDSAAAERIAKKLTITPEEQQRTLQYTKAVNDLGDQWERVAQQIGAALFPVLTWMGARTEESVQNMRETFTAFGGMVSAGWEAMRRNYGTELDQIGALTLQGIAALQTAWGAYYQFHVSLWGGISSIVASAIAGWVSTAQSAINYVVEQIRNIRMPTAPSDQSPAAPTPGSPMGPPRSPVTDVRPIEDINPEFLPPAFQDESARGGAGGGRVPGVGSGDIVPAWLTPNEFVMKVAAVRKYGLDFMRRVNSMQMPKLSLGGMVGGINDATAQFFAGGGLVGAGGRGRSEFTIVLDRQPFSASADRSVANSLFRTALKQKLVQANKKPGSRS
jgi:hypothetical protein